MPFTMLKCFTAVFWKRYGIPFTLGVKLGVLAQISTIITLLPVFSQTHTLQHNTGITSSTLGPQIQLNKFSNSLSSRSTLGDWCEICDADEFQLQANP